MAGYILTGAAVLVLTLWLLRRRPEDRQQKRKADWEQDRQWGEGPGAREKLPRSPEAGSVSPPSALPDRDSCEGGPLVNEGRQIAVELPAWIHYRDAKGQESRRDIVVRRLVEQRDEGDAILAFCEARQAIRTFVVSRILQFVDRQTGEIVSRVSDHLRAAYLDSPGGRVELALIERFSEVNVLAFVARADGAMRQKQRDIIADYLRNADPTLTGCDIELSTAIGALRPQQPDYRKHVRSAQSKPESARAALLTAVEAVAATRTTTREFTDSALQVARKAFGPQTPPKMKRDAPRNAEQS